MSYINLKKISAILLLAVMILTCRFFMSFGMRGDLSVAGVKAYIVSFGMWGPLIYMILFSVIPSGSVIAIAGGMVFGVYYGALYTLVGAVVGASVAFYVSRHLGRDAVEKKLRGTLQRFDAHLGQDGFVTILILRLMPIMPFNVVSYGAGLTEIKFQDYFYATILGIIPGVLIFTNLGEKALDVQSPQFLTAAGLLVLMVGGSLVLKKKYSW